MNTSKFLQFEQGPSSFISELNLPSWAEDRHICYIPVGAAILGGAGISGASSLAGGKKGASAATSAAQIQAQYEQQALAQQKQIYQQIQTNLQPYMDFGTAAMPNFTNYLTGAFAQPVQTYPSTQFSYPQFTGQPPAPFTFQPTTAQLQNVPGYQFASTQAGNAAVGQLIAQGRYGSGTAMAAADVGNQFAQTDWMNYYNALQQNYQAGLQGYQAQLSGYQTNFNAASSQYTTNAQALLQGSSLALQQKQLQLAGLEYPIGTGLSGAGASAGASVQAANTLGNTLTGIGASLASGQIGAANALTGGLTGLGSAASNAASTYAGYQNTQSLQQLYALNALGAGGNPNFNPAQNMGPMIQGDMGQVST